MSDQSWNPRPTSGPGPHPSRHPTPRSTRRGLLGWGAALVAGAAVTGCADAAPRLQERASCVARGDLIRRTELADLPLVYEVDGDRNAFWFDADFAARLEEWLADLRRIGLSARRLSTYGAWTDGGRTCDSWHDAGRAFDLARIELSDSRTLSCRYDQWQSESGSALRRARFDYWALAASLHRRFAYVVTYPYNAAHHNHIHIDNARSGRGPSVFNPRSPTQVQAVQAISSYVYEHPIQVTGRFDGATELATAAVLAELGGPRSLTDEGGWDHFLASAAARIAD